MIDDATSAVIRDRLAAELAPPVQRYRPLRVRDAIAGWLDDARAARLVEMRDVFAPFGDGIALVAALDNAAVRTRALGGVARTLSSEGLLTAWRDERYAVAPAFGAGPWFELERAAARYFGVHTYAAHINGLVRRGDDVAMWIARRSPTKSIDPGKLDNLVGGGIAAGQSIASTVVKEAWEEAGIPASIAATASKAGEVHLCREQADGLQRETIFVHELWLSPGFTPACRDGEVVDHRLVALPDAARLIAIGDGPDIVTADASLVILDCLLRHRQIAPASPHRAALEALRHPETGAVCPAGA